MSYLAHTNGNLPWVLASIAHATDNLNFSSVIVTGLSGIIPGAIFCHQFHRELVVIRKGEATHGNRIEGPRLWDKAPYILLDDFSESGATILRLLADAPDPIAIVLYQQGRVDIPTHRLPGSWTFTLPGGGPLAIGTKG